MLGVLIIPTELRKSRFQGLAPQARQLLRESFALGGVLGSTSLFLALSPPLFADGLSVQFKGGVSSFSLNAGQVYSQSGGIGIELRTQVNYEVTSINTSFGLFSQGHLGSNIGAFPLSRVGFATYYYLFGQPISSEPREDGVVISTSHMSPFISGQLELVSIAITDTITSPSQKFSFNGSVLGFIVGMGIEMPLTQSTSILGEFLYEGTLVGGSAASSSADLGSGSLSFTSIGGMLGLSFHP